MPAILMRAASTDTSTKAEVRSLFAEIEVVSRTTEKEFIAPHSNQYITAKTREASRLRYFMHWFKNTTCCAPAALQPHCFNPLQMVRRVSCNPSRSSQSLYEQCYRPGAAAEVMAEYPSHLGKWVYHGAGIFDCGTAVNPRRLASLYGFVKTAEDAPLAGGSEEPPLFMLVVHYAPLSMLEGQLCCIGCPAATQDPAMTTPTAAPMDSSQPESFQDMHSCFTSTEEKTMLYAALQTLQWKEHDVCPLEELPLSSSRSRAFDGSCVVQNGMLALLRWGVPETLSEARACSELHRMETTKLVYMPATELLSQYFQQGKRSRQRRNVFPNITTVFESGFSLLGDCAEEGSDTNRPAARSVVESSRAVVAAFLGVLLGVGELICLRDNQYATAVAINELYSWVSEDVVTGMVDVESSVLADHVCARRVKMCDTSLLHLQELTGRKVHFKQSLRLEAPALAFFAAAALSDGCSVPLPLELQHYRPLDHTVDSCRVGFAQAYAHYVKHATDPSAVICFVYLKDAHSTCVLLWKPEGVALGSDCPPVPENVDDLDDVVCLLKRSGRSMRAIVLHTNDHFWCAPFAHEADLKAADSINSAKDLKLAQESDTTGVNAKSDKAGEHHVACATEAALTSMISTALVKAVEPLSQQIASIGTVLQQTATLFATAAPTAAPTAALLRDPDYARFEAKLLKLKRRHASI